MSGTKIGGHLKAAREAGSLSSGDAAKKIGISAMTLSRYENDHRLPDANTLLAMTRVYSCDLVALMTGALGGDRPQAIPVRGKVADRTKFELELDGIPKETLPIMSDRPGAYAVKVVGNAMQPIAYHGEFIILDKPDAEPVLEVTSRGEGSELVRSRTVGRILGVFRKG